MKNFFCSTAFEVGACETAFGSSVVTAVAITYIIVLIKKIIKRNEI